MAEESRKKLSAKKARHINRKRLIRLIAVLILAAAALVLLIRLVSRRNFRSADLISDSEQSGGSAVSYLHLGGRILRYSQNGAAMLEGSGKELWNLSYVYAKPKAKLQGSYGAIADIGGTGACIFGRDGITGQITTNSPILNLAVSEKGTTVLILEEGTKSIIQFYDRTGKPLDISATLEMAISGFPLDAALSPDGTGLIVSAGAYLSGVLGTQIVFYNFAVGKGEMNRLVGYFTYENVLFPEIRYMGGEAAVAVGDDRLVFFDLSTENKPKVGQEVKFETEISAADAGEAHAAVVRSADSGTGLVLEVFDRTGRKCFAVDLTEYPRYLEEGRNYVLMTSASGVRLWDYKGRLRFTGLAEQDPQTVFAVDRNTLIQPSGGHLFRWRLR